MPRLALALLVGLGGCGGRAGDGFPAGLPGLPLPPGLTQPPADAPPPTATTPGSTRDPRFDGAATTLLAELEDNLAGGVSIAVSEGGIVTWAEGFGTSNPFDPEGRAKVTPATEFQIGGLTSGFTAAVALQQVEAGLLDLDAPVSALAPGFQMAVDPGWADAATLSHLLTHQSGLYDYNDWTGTSDDASLGSWTRGFYTDNLWTLNPPGAFFNPANINAVVVGMLVEEHDPAGRYYPDLLTEDLFAPLGMHESHARKAAVEARGVFALSTGLREGVLGYADIPMTEVPDAAQYRPSELAWSTPQDLCRWGNFLVHGDPEVLSDELRATLTAPLVSTLYVEDHQQHGNGLYTWDLFPLDDGYHAVTVWEDSGWTPSFTSELLILPERDVVVAITSNGYHDTWEETVAAVLRTVLVPFPARTGYPGPSFDPGQVPQHAGTYVDTFNIGEITVASDGADGLTIDMPVLAEQGYLIDPVLTPISTDRWIVEIEHVGFDLTFVRDPVTGGTTYVRDPLFVGTRTE